MKEQNNFAKKVGSKMENQEIQNKASKKRVYRIANGEYRIENKEYRVRHREK